MTAGHSIDDVPFETDVSGLAVYEAGYKLAQHGMPLNRIMWDCDELLWDWVLLARNSLKNVGRLVRRDLSHREWVRTKPGIWELIWGLHHGTLDSGEDARLRIATNGYPWRLWRMAQHIPGFDQLIAEGARLDDYDTWRNHPMLFCKPDYVRAATALLRNEVDRPASPARTVIAEHIDNTPSDSTLKLPEIAMIAGKPAFETVDILVDDSFRNIRRFARSGRIGIHADVPAKRLRRAGRIPKLPNTIWSQPESYLDKVSTPLGASVAIALEEALEVHSSDILVASARPARASSPTLDFQIDIDGDMIRAEWFEPVRRLKREFL